MQPKTSWNLEWLTAPGSESLSFPRGWLDLEHREIPLPPGGGQGHIELYHLGQGMDIFRGTATFPPAMTGQLVSVAVARGSVPEPMFGVHSARSGTVVIRERCAGTELIFRKDITLFQHVAHLDFDSLVDASEAVEVTVITMGVPVLATLVGQDSADRLLETLGIAQLSSAATKVLPQAVSQILYDTLPSGLSGQMRLLFSQAKTLEYLCALSALLAGPAAAPRGEARLAKAVAALRTELQGLEGKVPNLRELAQKYGLSAKALNEEFRKQNGTSIYAFISDFRLTESHLALERTDIPMKALAANLGYSHVNNYIYAFKKKFGYPPGSVRKGLGSA